MTPSVDFSERHSPPSFTLPAALSNPYVLSLVCSVFALLLTQLVNRMGQVSTVLLYVVAVIICSELAGFRSGLLTLAITLMASLYDMFYSSAGMNAQGTVRFVLFVLIASSTCWLLGHRHFLHRQLKIAKMAAEESAKAKSEFLANMSHEIRTPLNGIVGMAELAQHTDSYEERNECLNTVRTCADSLLSIVESILDFSRLESNGCQLETAEFLVRERVMAAVKAVTIAADVKRLELSVDCSADVPMRVMGDPRRLQQVLINLLANAIEFTEHGAIVVRVWPERHSNGPLVLHFSVRDTGCGIAPDKQKLIFESFRQADGSTTRVHGGIGLGLAACAKLVHLMGGQIWVESHVNQGSTFHFTAVMGDQVENINTSARPQLPSTALQGAGEIGPD